jgi:single-stranded-DNA-specific exonuclease
VNERFGYAILVSVSKIIRDILNKRGLTEGKHEAFLNPNYDATRYDAFLLPDMTAAVERILRARDHNEKVVIYGDYDVDGLAATAILLDALPKFGLEVSAYTPDRFTEGYGLNMEALRGLAATDASLVITVDCGSLSHDEIKTANELKLDVIVTDHHAVAETMPPAVAVINPHRPDSQYPFADLAGCGVAFKLVQALQAKLDGLSLGQEKWLLDLVALGTVCDIVPLVDENRNNVHWGIEVLKKTRRPGLRALMAVTKTVPSTLNSRALGFVLGPRLNAAGRLATAQSALELLTTTDSARALELARNLDDLNRARRAEQDKIFAEACEILEHKNSISKDGPWKVGEGVIVVDSEGWNEGVIGIVASKLMEKYGRPTFVMSVGDSQVKGSGRSFGDFNLAAAIEATREHLEKGGGHAAAGGVTLRPENLDKWRTALNQFHSSLSLQNQEKFLLASEDTSSSRLSTMNIELVNELAKLEPYGMANERPVFRLNNLYAQFVDRIGKDKNHLKLTVGDGDTSLKFLAFDAPKEWFVQPGDYINVWVNLELNEWQGRQAVEGRILRLELAE